MPHIALFHGFAETPDGIWFPYIKEELEPLGHRVIYQKLPHPREPHLDAWVDAALPLTSVWNERTIVVGHSLGGLLAMRLLERASTPAVHALITVGTPYALLDTPCSSLIEFLEGGLDCVTLRRKAYRYLFLHAHDDDVVPFYHAQCYAALLNGELRPSPSGGHFIEIDAPEVLGLIKEVLADYR